MRTVAEIRKCMERGQYSSHPVLSKKKLDEMCKEQGKWYASWCVHYNDGDINYLWGGAGDTPDDAIDAAYKKADWYINGGKGGELGITWDL